MDDGEVLPVRDDVKDPGDDGESESEELRSTTCSRRELSSSSYS